MILSVRVGELTAGDNSPSYPRGPEGVGQLRYSRSRVMF